MSPNPRPVRLLVWDGRGDTSRPCNGTATFIAAAESVAGAKSTVATAPERRSDGRIAGRVWGGVFAERGGGGRTAAALAELEDGRPFDVVLALGADACRGLARVERCRGRLVARAADLLAIAERVPRRKQRTIAEAVGAALCSSEDARSRLEQRLPMLSERTVFLHPQRLETDVRRLLNRLAPQAPATWAEPRRVLFSGPGFGFIRAVAERLERLDTCEVRYVAWRHIGAAAPAHAREATEWANVVVCEWAGRNAAWHARNKTGRQRLIVRLHRFEADTQWPGAVDWRAVDQLIAVSPAFRRRLAADLPGLAPERAVALPNYVDPLIFDREKTAGARFHLGLLGAVPMRKRLDLALDVLAEVRRRDARFRLFVKGRRPWQRPAWRRAEERAYYASTMRRVRRDPLLRGAVEFEPYGPDVGNWLRKIGTVLSTSEAEGSHVAVAEGMMSRASAVVLPWPGAHTVYPRACVVADTAAAAQRILEQSDRALWERNRQCASRFAERFALDRVFDAWTDILVRDRAPTAWTQGR